MITILVIDDEKDICQCFADLVMLEHIQMNVLTADNGTDGIKLFKKHKPDLVFVDLQLNAAMDGVEVIKQIRSIDSSVKIVIISGFIDTSNEDPVRPWGADFCVMKPFTPEEIMRVIAKIAKQNEGG